MNNKKIRVAIAVLATSIIGLGGWWAAATIARPSEVSQSISTNTQQVEREQSRLSITADGREVRHEGEAGKTALATLRKLTTVETTESAYGEFVSSIQGVAADSSKEFWAFYVNGNVASEGAGTYTARAGDTITWKLEEF